MDGSSLSRVLELIEFWNRKVNEKGEVEGIPESPEDAQNDFMALQEMMPGISKMPSEMKDDIAWAEEFMKKNKLN